jgi:hypothetical protein
MKQQQKKRHERKENRSIRLAHPSLPLLYPLKRPRDALQKGMAEPTSDEMPGRVVLVVRPEEEARMLGRNRIVVYLERGAEVKPSLGDVREDRVDAPAYGLHHALGIVDGPDHNLLACRLALFAESVRKECMVRSQGRRGRKKERGRTLHRRRWRARQTTWRTRRRCPKSRYGRRWCLLRCTSGGSRAGFPLRAR